MLKLFLDPQVGDLVQVPIQYRLKQPYVRETIYGFGIYMGIGKYKTNWEDRGPKHMIFVQNSAEYIHYMISDIYHVE